MKPALDQCPSVWVSGTSPCCSRVTPAENGEEGEVTEEKTSPPLESQAETWPYFDICESEPDSPTNKDEQATEDPGAQQVENTEQELVEGEEQVAQEEVYYEEYELV